MYSRRELLGAMVRPAVAVAAVSPSPAVVQEAMRRHLDYSNSAPVTGIDSGKLAQHLWNRHRIVVTPIVHPEFEGLRITPSVYTTLQEIDFFGDAMESVIERGLPA